MRKLRDNLKEEDLELVLTYDTGEITYLWDIQKELRENEDIFWELVKSSLKLENWNELDRDDLTDLIEIWNEYLDCILLSDEDD